MNSIIVLNLLISVAVIFLLAFLHVREVTLTKRVFLALILGLVFGSVLEYLFLVEQPDIIQGTISYLDIIGIGYIRLLQMVIMPLILVSIIAAIIQLEEQHSIKRVGLSTISVLLITTMISALVAIFVANLFGLNASGLPTAGGAEIAREAHLQEVLAGLKDSNFATMLLNFIPSNLFYDLAGMRSTSTIAVVIAASLIGMALLRLQQDEPEKAKPFTDFLHSMQALVMRLVKMVLELTPYGVFALITKVIANSNLHELIDLLEFIVASYVAIGIMFILHLIIIAFSGIGPFTYLQKAFPVLTFAFTSRSSAGSIPMNIQTQMEQFNIPRGIANFSASLGATIGQNGCAGIYPAMLAVMVAPTVGVDPTSWHFIVMLCFVVTISSLGVAGVGGGATFAALIVLSTMSLPVTIVALLISIEPLIDMARTTLNVNGAITAGIVTNRFFGQASEK